MQEQRPRGMVVWAMRWLLMSLALAGWLFMVLVEVRLQFMHWLTSPDIDVRFAFAVITGIVLGMALVGSLFAVDRQHRQRFGVTMAIAWSFALLGLAAGLAWVGKLSVVDFPDRLRKDALVFLLLGLLITIIGVSMVFKLTYRIHFPQHSTWLIVILAGAAASFTIVASEAGEHLLGYRRLAVLTGFVFYAALMSLLMLAPAGHGKRVLTAMLILMFCVSWTAVLYIEARAERIAIRDSDGYETYLGIVLSAWLAPVAAFIGLNRQCGGRFRWALVGILAVAAVLGIAGWVQIDAGESIWSLSWTQLQAQFVPKY